MEKGRARSNTLFQLGQVADIPSRAVFNEIGFPLPYLPGSGVIRGESRVAGKERVQTAVREVRSLPLAVLAFDDLPPQVELSAIPSEHLARTGMVPEMSVTDVHVVEVQHSVYALHCLFQEKARRRRGRR